MVLLGIAFFLSGAAALVYQVLWQRILTLPTGIGAAPVPIILAAFMAGLGLGSHVGGVLSARVSPRRARRVFALLEAAVGMFLVADGMGGHLAGEVASQWAIQTLKRDLAPLCPTEAGRSRKTQLQMN